MTAPYGAFHGLEIAYVFGSFSPRLQPTEQDRKLSKVMSACWAQFSKTGDPNGPGLPPWPAYEAATDRHMEFGDAVGAKAGLYREACDLLDQVTAKGRAARDTTPVRRKRPRRPAPATAD